MNTKQSLSSMCYEEGRKEWTNWFLDVQKERARWDRRIYSKEDGDFLDWLGCTEMERGKINWSENVLHLNPASEYVVDNF